MKHAHDDSDLAARLIAKVIRDLTTGMRFDSYADFKDALRRRLARLRISYTPSEFDDAISVVASNRAIWSSRPTGVVDDADDSETRPLTRAEAADGLARIRERFPVTIHGVERVRELTRDEVAARAHAIDRARALRMIRDAITETAARCDALERDIPAGGE